MKSCAALGHSAVILCEVKENIRRGSWLIWLPVNLPELGRTNSARTENASRCMRFFKDNPPKIGNSRFVKPPAEFSPDSKRKFLWGLRSGERTAVIRR